MDNDAIERAIEAVRARRATYPVSSEMYAILTKVLQEDLSKQRVS